MNAENKDLEFGNKDHWNPDRRVLLGWLKQKSPSLAELYEAAVFMLYSSPPFPGRIHLISHSVREIRNRLSQVTVGHRGGSQLNYKDRMNPIRDLWQKSGIPFAGIPQEVDEEDPGGDPIVDIQIPVELFSLFQALVQDHHLTREKPFESAKRLFEFICGDTAKDGALHLVIKEWIQTTEWFVERAHHPGKEHEAVDYKEFEAKFCLFESTLLAAIRTFYQTVKEIDEILEKTNS